MESMTPDLRPVLRVRALDPSSTPGAGNPRRLTESGLTLGRSEDNSFIVSGERWPSASGHHCRIDVREGAGWVVDLGSSNGTLVNDATVQDALLAPGDVIQLGARGPRFLVLGAATLSETVVVDRSHVGIDSKLTETTVRHMVQRRTHKNAVVSGIVLLMGIAAAAWGWRVMEQRRVDDVTASQLELQEARNRLNVQIVELTDTRETAALEQQAELARLRSEYIGELSARETERDELLSRINLLENETETSEEMGTLRAQIANNKAELIEASRRVELLDPLNLEQARLAGVSKVRPAVLLLETKVTLVDRITGKTLHVADPVRGIGPNFDDLGVPFTLEATGSGFCISPEGWIITNRHVVTPPKDDDLLAVVDKLPLDVVFEVSAVFTGTDVRIPAEVVLRHDNSDLALVHIEPFEGMPYIEDFDAGMHAPAPGADVYVMGFPLGTFAIQEGDRVIASTFRGIYSRLVDGNMQVDAAVHPGNSGGPILDSQGRVIGIVFSVQAAPDQTAVYTIGYGIPVGNVGGIWSNHGPVGVAAPPLLVEDGDETTEALRPGEDD
jgi:S1-C subfamily serine protease